FSYHTLLTLSLVILFHLSSFLFHSSGYHRDLHSFPTRRSSDLARPGVVGVVHRVVGRRPRCDRVQPSRNHACRGSGRCHAVRVHRDLHLGPLHAPGPPPLVPSHGTTHVGGAARRCRR